MPRFRGQIHDNRILINVLVSAFKVSDEKPEYKPFVALVDTGATRTVISPAVAEKLNLIPTGFTRVNTASHPIDAKTYNINLIIPITENGIGVDGKPVQSVHMRPFISTTVSEASNLSVQGIELLLGMDIIRQCLLIVDGDQFILNY